LGDDIDAHSIDDYIDVFALPATIYEMRDYIDAHAHRRLP